MVPGPRFNIKMSSYQYRKSHCGDKTILRPSYLHNGISYTDKTSLYWIGPLVSDQPFDQSWEVEAISWLITTIKHRLQQSPSLASNLLITHSQPTPEEKLAPLSTIVQRGKWGIRCYNKKTVIDWRRCHHGMETVSVLLALCDGNPPTDPTTHSLGQTTMLQHNVSSEEAPAPNSDHNMRAMPSKRHNKYEIGHSS